jgi:hypothetical protein
MAAKKTEEAATRIKFIQISASEDTVYALSEDGCVFVYVDDDKTGEHGWYQLDADDNRERAIAEGEEIDGD